MYMLNSFGVAIGFVGPHRIRNNLYDFFFRKVEGFFNANLYGMGCIMVGRTFFESIPSILTMILIASLYLIGVIFYLWKKYRYNHAIWHFLYSQLLFVTTSLSYWRSRLSDYKMN
jgi:hemolysin III